MRFSAAAAVLSCLLLAAAPQAARAARRAKPKAPPAPAAPSSGEPQVGSAAWHLDRAKALMDAKQYATAAAAARRACALAPYDPKCHIAAADASYAAGRYDDAYAEASDALALDPPNLEARRIAALAKGHIPSLATAVVDSPERSAPEAGGLRGPGRRRWALAFGAALLLGGALAALVLRRRSRRRSAEPAAERPPRTESYRIVREIGTGGMGRVYEAMDVHLERRVAIKRLRDEIRSDPRERQRFFQEARLVAALRHPNIVLIHSVVEEEDDAYLVFEFIDGHTLAEYISHWGSLHLAHAVWVAQGVAAALDYAHSRGVVHRDLKPSNVMLTPDGHLKVMDFGVARQAMDSIHSISGELTVAGTPPYMAPEQEEGGASPQCDVFALAVCVYEMLTGLRPFQGSGAGMVLQKQRQDYIPVSALAEGLPPGIDDTLAWGLAPAPSARCASAGAFASNLEALLRGDTPIPGEYRW